MGIHRYIKELNPVILYTFDPRQTFVENGSGVFVSNTETEVPPLVVNTSGIFYNNTNIRSIKESLSEIEFGSAYKSYCSGDPDYYKFNVGTTFYTINNSSSYAEANLDDALQLFANSTYTVFFQTSGFSLVAKTSQVLPYYIFNDTISSNSYFGYTSRTRFEENNVLEFDTMYFGIESFVQDNIFFPYGRFGFSSVTDLTTNPLNQNTQISSNPGLFLNNTNTYQSSVMDKTYFTFRNIRIECENISSNIGYYLITASGRTLLFSTPEGVIVNVFLTVNPSNNTVKCSINKLNPNTYTLPTLTTNNIRIGYRTSLVNAGNILGRSDLFRMNFPRMNISFDNVTVYPFEVMDQDRFKISDLNRSYINRFKDYGFTQLYDFSDYYDNKSTRYINNNETINNILGNDFLFCSTVNDDRPFVKKDDDGIFNHVFKCTPQSAIRSFRTSGLLGGNNIPISMIRSAGTVTFSFKTIDNNGIIFSNSVYESNPSNFSIYMNGGNIEIWTSNQIRTSLLGYSDNQWHRVYIVLTTTSCRFYLDGDLIYTHSGNLIKTDALTILGESLPSNRSFECEYALIGFTTLQLTPLSIQQLEFSDESYTSTGQITLNNIGIGTNIYIYNRDDGSLIERIISDELTGLFSYTNRFPFTISILVTDSTLRVGKTYIVDPVEIQ